MRVYKSNRQSTKLSTLVAGELFLLDTNLCIVLHAYGDNSYTCFDFENEETFSELGTTMVELVAPSKVSIKIE